MCLLSPTYTFEKYRVVLLSELDTNFTLAQSGGGAFCGSPMSLMPINFFDIGKFHTPYSFCHAKIFVPLNIILRPLFA